MPKLISDLPARGSNIADTDLVEIETAGGDSQYVTGAQILAAVNVNPPAVVSDPAAQAVLDGRYGFVGTGAPTPTTSSTFCRPVSPSVALVVRWERPTGTTRHW